MLNLYEHSKKPSIRPTAVILLYVFVKTPKETFRPIACVDFVLHLYIKATGGVTWSGHCDTCINLVLHLCIYINTEKDFSSDLFGRSCVYVVRAKEKTFCSISFLHHRCVKFVLRRQQTFRAIFVFVVLHDR